MRRGYGASGSRRGSEGIQVQRERDDEQKQQSQRDHDTTEDEAAKGLRFVGIRSHFA